MSESRSNIQPAVPAHPVTWLAGGLIGVGILALLAANLPERAKLLGLFPLIWGAAVGAGLGWWANECHVKSAWWVLLAGWCCLALGEAGIVVDGWRHYQQELRKKLAEDPSAKFGPPVQTTDRSKLTADEKLVLEQFEAEQKRVRELRRWALSFPGYLQRRWRRLRLPASPWPEIVFVGEILGGSLLGVCALRRAMPSTPVSRPLPADATPGSRLE